tara:strand:- start:98 stop:334 length:237 start_codon:yes stop_codon:yes gene_type:complete
MKTQKEKIEDAKKRSDALMSKLIFRIMNEMSILSGTEPAQNKNELIVQLYVGVLTSLNKKATDKHELARKIVLERDYE